MLSTREFQILGSIGPGERSGRDIATDFREKSGGAISYGTLYTTLRRMQEAGLVTSRDSRDGDGRIRFFRITAGGRIAVENARSNYMALATFGLKGGAA